MSNEFLTNLDKSPPRGTGHVFHNTGQHQVMNNQGGVFDNYYEGTENHIDRQINNTTNIKDNKIEGFDMTCNYGNGDKNSCQDCCKVKNENAMFKKENEDLKRRLTDKEEIIKLLKRQNASIVEKIE